MSKPTRITEIQYHNACEDQAGFCTACKEITNEGGCEPDASNYTCELCEQKKVFGMELALCMGLVTL